jgi:tetratricopeptide (TPR) repeat protein
MAPLTWLAGSDLFFISALLPVGLSLALIAWIQRRQASQNLRGNVALAFQLHDFQRVLEIGRSAPTAVARDHWLRYHIAFSRAVCGDRSEAIVELEELWRDAPGFPITALTLGALLLDAGQPERALDVARWAAGRLPNDAATHLLVAKSLRRLGRLEEARAASERSLTLEPEGGLPHAIAAAIALDNGDFHRAQELVDAALEFGPGEVYSLLVNAEVVAKARPFEDPRAAVEQAIAAVHANPFAFYRPEVTQLSQWLAELESSSPANEFALAAPLA